MDKDYEQPEQSPEYYNSRQVEHKLGFEPRTIAYWIKVGKVPAPEYVMKGGRKLRVWPRWQIDKMVRGEE